MTVGSIMNKLGEVKMPFAGGTWTIAVTTSSVAYPIPEAWYGKQVSMQADGEKIYFLSGGESVEVDETTVTGVDGEGALEAPTGTEGGFIAADDTDFYTPRKDGSDIETHVAFKAANACILRCWISDHPERD